MPIAFDVAGLNNWYNEWIKKRMSAPEPPNPFQPVPENRPEDWREGEEEDDD